MILSIYIDDYHARINGYEVSRDIAFEIKALEKQLAEARKEIESLKKFEQDRYRSASKAFGLEPPMYRKREKLKENKNEKN